MLLIAFPSWDASAEGQPKPTADDRRTACVHLRHGTDGPPVCEQCGLAQQVGRTLADDVRLADLAHLPTLRLPTARALQEVVAMAGTWADADARQVGQPLPHRFLEAAALDFKPNYDETLHEFIALTAVNMTSFQSLLPWRCRTGLREDAEIPEYFEELVDANTGAVDGLRLRHRLNELQEALFPQRLMQ